jgi:hypothetical protein
MKEDNIFVQNLVFLCYGLCVYRVTIIRSICKHQLYGASVSSNPAWP